MPTNLTRRRFLSASLADARLSDRMPSQHGHVFLRVSQQRRQYQLFVLDDTHEEGAIKATFALYAT